MHEVNKTSLSRMGKLNNAVCELIGATDCNTIEVITVLKQIAFRLDKAFELSVMGNPIKSIAEKVK